MNDCGFTMIDGSCVIGGSPNGKSPSAMYVKGIIMGEILFQIGLALFALFYIFGGCHALFDGWRPWKYGIKWWKFYD